MFSKPFTPLITLLLLCLLAVLLVSCTSAAATPTPTGLAITLQDCQLSSPGVAVRIPARCGQFQVAEDPADPDGAQISLNLAVIPAVSRNPAPDPLFFITGGPGQAATESYPQLSGAFERIRQKRDIVLVDQRGTGKSNPLTCSDVASEETGGEDDPEETTRQLQKCLAALNADPTLYTTSKATDDLDQVRSALGYEQINLYGVSYGTRVAQAYLQRFPERTRAIVLDGVVPQEQALGQFVARDAQRSLNLIFERCEADAACHQAFPNIRSEFSDLLAELRESPVSVSLAHPISGERTDLTFSDTNMAIAVRLLSYAPETVALLPLIIHTAHAQDDFSLLASQYLIVTTQLVESISIGMNFSVLCSEDVPFIDPDDAEQANAGTYLGDLQTTELFKACEVWPRGEIPADFKQPVKSDVPVLLLSGEFDPVTPPGNGDLVAQHLSNSLHLVAPGQGHNVVFRGCLPGIVTAFVDSGSLQGLDTTCVQEITPAPFFINFAGPQP